MPEAVAKVENGLLAWHITDPFAHVDTNLLRGRNLLFTTHQVEAYGDARAKEARAEALTPIQLAQKFHEAYERLAPSFGYETRTETRNFGDDPKNANLMVAVCAEILAMKEPQA
jgi:hypothetical protein